MSRERQLARLFRALIACCAFLFAAEAPLLPLWSARDASGWVAARPPASAAPRSPAAPQAPGARRPSRSGGATPRTASRALAARTAAAGTAAKTMGSRLDRRYLFLEIQTLLC
jgi:hypothetical protein